MLLVRQNTTFLFILLVFYVNICSINLLNVANKLSLSKSNLNTLSQIKIFNQNEYNNEHKKNLGNNEKKFDYINSELDSFTSFIDNLILNGVEKILIKEVKNELVVNQKKYLEPNNIDSSILSQISSDQKNSTLSNPVKIDNKTTPQSTKLSPKGEINKTDISHAKQDIAPSKNSNVLSNAIKNSNVTIVKNDSHLSTTNNSTKEQVTEKIGRQKSELKPANVILKVPANKISNDLIKKDDMDKTKNEINKIKLGNGNNIKIKTNNILDEMKKLDEKETNLVKQISGLVDDSIKNTNKKITYESNRSDGLEKELENQKKNAVEIKNLYAQVSGINLRINKLDDKNNELSGLLSDLRNNLTSMKYKIIAGKIDTDNQMMEINHKLEQQLKLVYTNKILDLQKTAAVIQKKIEGCNERIKIINSKLPETSEACSILNNCNSCTANPNCGWCSMTQVCVPGNKNGPSNGQCNFFEYGQCGAPRDCDSNTNCEVIILIFLIFVSQ